MDVNGYPNLSHLLDSDEAWEVLGDFDGLMEGAQDRLNSIDANSEAGEAAKLLHEFARDHFHLLLVSKYKVREIGRGIQTALDAKNETVLFNLTRAFVENTAALAYQINAIEKAVSDLPKKSNIEGVREAIARHQKRANALYYNEGAAIHVNDMLDELAKYSENLRKEYDDLCEFVHPNYGSNKLVSSGDLGAGKIGSRSAELEGELAATRRITEHCAMLVEQEFTKSAAYLLGTKIASWVNIASQDQAKLSQVFSQRNASVGDGKTKETAIFFKKARTHQEAMEAFYKYLESNKLTMLGRQTAAVEEGFLYDKVTTSIGEIWVKYRMSM